MKHPVVRGIVAVVAGMIVATLVVILLEMLALAIYPMPAGLDPKDKIAMGRFIASLPLGAFLVVLSALFLGALAGGWTAGRIGRSRMPVIIVIVVSFCAAVTNMLTIPHPAWMWITVPLLYAVAGALAVRLTLRSRTLRPA